MDPPEGQPLPEKDISRNTEEILSPTTQRVAKFLEAGVIKRNFESPNNRWQKSYILDTNKAVEVLEGIKSERQANDLTVEIKGKDLLLEGQTAFRQAVKSLVDHNVIPTDLAVQVGRLVKPPDIELIDTDFARFLYLKDNFPAKGEERASLELGRKYALGWGWQELDKAIKSQGVNLSLDQTLRVVLRSGISHEYGHAVDRALLFLNVEAKMAAQPEADAWQLMLESGQEVSQDIYSRIAPNDDLAEILQGELEDGTYTRKERTSSERLGTGFGYLGLRYALEDLQVDQQKIDGVINYMVDDDFKTMQGNKRVAGEIKKQGLTLEDWGNAMTDLNMDLRDRGRSDLREITRDFSARSLGYAAPLSEEQIKALVTTWNTTPKISSIR